MGSLILPKSGRVYIDTQIVIYTVEKHPVFSPLLLPFWQSVQAGTATAVTSELTILEMLVHPLRHNDQPVVEAYHRFTHQPGLALEPISRGILGRGAEMRAKIQKLRTPDAIHAATAVDLGCVLFLTNDEGLRSLTEIQVVVLGDLRN
jgi:predicted nucleic acid-binding protein